MTDAQPVSPPEVSPAEEAIRRLEALGTELEKLGYRTRVDIVVGAPPSLYVQNPEEGADALQDRIYCAPRGGQRVFWWSWAEPVAELVPDAAAIIARTLRSAG